MCRVARVQFVYVVLNENGYRKMLPTFPLPPPQHTRRIDNYWVSNKWLIGVRSPQLYLINLTLLTYCPEYIDEGISHFVMLEPEPDKNRQNHKSYRARIAY